MFNLWALRGKCVVWVWTNPQTLQAHTPKFHGVETVNCACFPRDKHPNSQKRVKFMNFPFRPFLWFGLPGRLLIQVPSHPECVSARHSSTDRDDHHVLQCANSTSFRMSPTALMPNLGGDPEKNTVKLVIFEDSPPKFGGHGFSELFNFFRGVR